MKPPANIAPILNVQNVPLDRIHPSGWNNRRPIDEKASKFLDFVANVRAVGVMSPVIVRPHPTKGADHYELLAGERRWRASRAAGYAEVPCSVRDLDDDAALDVTIIENFQREDLSPMEEARGVASLMKSGRDCEAVGAKLGKSPAWVAKRAQLLKLVPVWQQAADKWDIPAAYLELVARNEAALQETLAQWAGIGKNARQWDLNNNVLSRGALSHLREKLGNLTRELKHARWKLDDALLHPEAGACATCPARSSCQPLLFEDDIDGEGRPLKPSDRCLRPECWDEKQKRHFAREKAALRTKHPDAVEVSESWYSNNKSVIGRESYETAKKGSAGAVPAFVVDGSQPGRIIYVTLSEKAERKAEKQAKKAAGDKTPVVPLAERKALLEKRRWKLVAESLSKKLEEAESLPPGIPSPKRTAETLVALASAWGINGHHDALDCKTGRVYPGYGHGNDAWTLFDALNNAGGDLKAARILWRAIVPRLRQSLELHTVGDWSPAHQANAARIAQLLGEDIASLKTVADIQIPTPGSWKKEIAAETAQKIAAENKAERKAAKKAAKKAAPAKKAPKKATKK